MHAIAMYVLGYGGTEGDYPGVSQSLAGHSYVSLPSFLSLCLFEGLSWGLIVWCAAFALPSSILHPCRFET
jgi:hypothetical protein